MIDPNYTFFIQLINFIILLLVLERVLYRPAIAFLKERRQKQDNWHHAAETDRSEAEKTRSEYTKMLISARKEALQVQTEMITQAELEAGERLARVRAEQHDILVMQRNQLEQEKQVAKEALKREIENLSGIIVKRLTRTSHS